MRTLALCLLFLCHYAVADTIDHYMSIASNIPKMEMKADAQSQTWARSARNVLIITCESIAETMTQANKYAQKEGSPFFCLSDNKPLSANLLDELIQQTYKELPGPPSQKDKMTVSEIAWTAVRKHFPCKQSSNYAKQMKHVNALLAH